jgi:chitodextrinase
VRAFDAAGWLSPPSPAKSVTTLAPPDDLPPTTPGTPLAYPFSSTQILLVWPASTDNNRVTGYQVFRNGANLGSTPFPAWFDQNLSPATTYYYAVVAVDAAGNFSPASKVTAVTTLPPPDRTPPSIPANLRATSLAVSQVSLAWGASTDNVRTAGYKVFRNGTLISVSVVPSFTDQLVFPNTAYSYTVAAFDAAGNTSAQSAPLAVTTPPR